MSFRVLLLVALAMVAVVAQKVYPRERCRREDNCYIILQGGRKVCYFIRSGRGNGYDCYYDPPSNTDINLFPEIHMNGGVNHVPTLTVMTLEDTPYSFELNSQAFAIDDRDANDLATDGIAGVVKLLVEATHGFVNFTDGPQAFEIGIDNSPSTDPPPDTSWPGFLWYKGCVHMCRTIEVYGIIEDVNLALQHLVFYPDTNAFTELNNPTTNYDANCNAGQKLATDAAVLLTIDDRGHTGPVNEIATTAITIQIKGVNDLPTITPQNPPTTVNEDTPLAFSSGHLVVADVDNLPSATFSSGRSMRMRLTGTSGALLTSTGAGLTRSENISGIILGFNNPLSSSPLKNPLSTDDLNNILSTLIYTPAPNFNGIDTITITVWDINSALPTTVVGWDAVPKTVFVLTLTVVAVNDAPIITFGTFPTIYEDIPSLLPTISFTDVESAISTYKVEIKPECTLAPNCGVLVFSCSPRPCNMSSGGHQISFNGSGTYSDPMVIEGTYPALSIALLTLVNYSSKADWYSGWNNQNESLRVTITDWGPALLKVNSSKVIPVLAVNDDPSVTSTLTSVTATHGTTVSLGSVVMADKDTLDLTLSSRHVQILVAADSGMVMFPSPLPTAVASLDVSVPSAAIYDPSLAYPAILFTGILSDINLAVANMRYVAPASAGTDRIYFSMHDLLIYGQGTHMESEPFTLVLPVTVT